MPPEDMAKHTVQKSIAVYEKILRGAWKITWKHKELWLLGLFAGLAYSGTLLKNIFSAAARVQPADRITIDSLEQSTSGATYILTYARTLLDLPAARLIITFVAALIVLCAVAYVLVMTQHLLLSGIHRSANRKKHMTVGQMFEARKHAHFWRIFSIDAIAIIANTLISAGLSIPLALLLSDAFFSNFLVYLAVYALALPLLFCINVFTMFALVNVVRKEDGIDNAFMRAAAALRKHWLVAAEMTLILFLINLISYVVFFIGIAFITLLLIPFFFAALSAGSVLLMAVFGVMLAITASVLYLTCFGAITTFNYAAWTLVVERLERFGALPGLEGMFAKFKR